MQHYLFSRCSLSQFSIAVPTAISSFIVGLVVILFVDTEQPRHGKYRAPETGILVSRQTVFLQKYS